MTTMTDETATSVPIDSAKGSSLVGGPTALMGIDFGYPNLEPIYTNQVRLATPNGWLPTRPEDWALPARRLIFTLAGDRRTSDRH